MVKLLADKAAVAAEAAVVAAFVAAAAAVREGQKHRRQDREGAVSQYDAFGPARLVAHRLPSAGA